MATSPYPYTRKPTSPKLFLSSPARHAYGDSVNAQEMNSKVPAPADVSLSAAAGYRRTSTAILCRHCSPRPRALLTTALLREDDISTSARLTQDAARHVDGPVAGALPRVVMKSDTSAVPAHVVPAVVFKLKSPSHDRTALHGSRIPSRGRDVCADKGIEEIEGREWFFARREDGARCEGGPEDTGSWRWGFEVGISDVSLLHVLNRSGEPTYLRLGLLPRVAIARAERRIESATAAKPPSACDSDSERRTARAHAGERHGGAGTARDVPWGLTPMKRAAHSLGPSRQHSSHRRDGETHPSMALPSRTSTALMPIFSQNAARRLWRRRERDVPPKLTSPNICQDVTHVPLDLSTSTRWAPGEVASSLGVCGSCSIQVRPYRGCHSESDKKPGEVATQRLIVYLLFLFDVFPMCVLPPKWHAPAPDGVSRRPASALVAGAEREKEAPECGAKRTAPGLHGGRGAVGYWEELKFFQNLQVLAVQTPPELKIGCLSFIISSQPQFLYYDFSISFRNTPIKGDLRNFPGRKPRGRECFSLGETRRAQGSKIGVQKKQASRGLQNGMGTPKAQKVSKGWAARFWATGVNDLWAVDEHEKWKYKFGLALHSDIDPVSPLVLGRQCINIAKWSVSPPEVQQNNMYTHKYLGECDRDAARSQGRAGQPHSRHALAGATSNERERKQESRTTRHSII
ncbi:hypothetical protein DFH09DRAFT_1281734 [Mycena vulgaris]|nr:hypothetical protein DFH09DRAFT_1281734 [Mycena vulgaris]